MTLFDTPKCNLPLLHFVLNKYKLGETQPFKGMVCVFIQHLLGSNVSLLNALETGGIQKKDFHIIGKAYSSNSQVLSFLSQNGYDYINPIEGYSTDICYDEFFTQKVREFIANLIQSTSSDILLVDDAAKGISVIHETPFRKYLSRFRCVELTTRGIRSLQNINIGCPIVDIASSYVKRNVESVLIAESMVREFLLFLDKWKSFYTPLNRHVLVIGYGAIGSRVCELLKEQFCVTVFDNDPERNQEAQHNGFQIFTALSEVHYGVIIGCTGLSFPLKELINGASTLLVNMSSSDLEFGLWRFKGKKCFMRKITNSNIEELPLHEFYCVEQKNKQIYIANGGFPIDFTGGIDPIPPFKIQITRALVLSACYQACESSHSGITMLSNDFQNELLENFNSTISCVQ